MQNSLKKKDNSGIDDKRIRNSSDVKHTQHCSKHKDNLGKNHHTSKQELSLLRPELVEIHVNKHHCKKKKQQPQQQLNENVLNKKVKKKRSLKIIDKPNSQIVNNFNKCFIVENNPPIRSNETKRVKHRECKEKEQHIKEPIVPKNNDLSIRGCINTLFEKFKIKPESKEIDIIYSRSAKKQAQIHEDSMRRYSGENLKHLKKEIKRDKMKCEDDEIKQIKRIILEEIKSEEHKFNNHKKLIDRTIRFDNFNGVLDSELTVVNSSMITHSELVHNNNCMRSISVGTSKSCKLDIGCQVSMIRLTATHNPPACYIPTGSQRTRSNHSKERSSKIPVAINNKATSGTINDKDDYGHVSFTNRSPGSKNISALRSTQNDRQSRRLLRQKTLNLPPKVVEIQYLTDLTREPMDNFDDVWLNQKYYNFNNGEEYLKNLKNEDPIQAENQETSSVKDVIQSPKKQKLKIKENTFNINFKTQTKIHICQKSKRLNTRKYRKNRSCSRKKSTISVKENSKPVSDAATVTEIGSLTSSFNELLRDNSDFLQNDFSFITETNSRKFDGDSEFRRNNDRFSLNTLNSPLKFDNPEKMVIDFSTMLDSKNDEYFTLKSIEDVLNQPKLDDYRLKSNSLINLEAKKFETFEPSINPTDSITSLSTKNLEINEEICPIKEIALDSASCLDDRRNGRYELGRFFRYIFRINKWKLSKSLSCMHKDEDS